MDPLISLEGQSLRHTYTLLEREHSQKAERSIVQAPVYNEQLHRSDTFMETTARASLNTILIWGKDLFSVSLRNYETNIKLRVDAPKHVH